MATAGAHSDAKGEESLVFRPWWNSVDQSRSDCPGGMDETYDAIVLGTGLKECIISGLLSVDGLKARGCWVDQPVVFILLFR